MILLLALLLLLATFSTKLADRLGIPGMIVFLVLGMIFGSDGLNLIYFDNPVLAQKVATAFLIIILFEGGFNTKKELLKVAFKPAFSLATVGIIITAASAGILFHLVIGLSLESSILIGAIISSTDAAAVFALFRNKSIQPKTAATLEIESASNDPMAIILTILIIDYMLGTLSNPFLFLLNLAWQITAGLAIGYLIGKLSPHLFNRARLDNGGFYYVLILGVCFLSFGLADQLKTNGFLAVYIAGFYVGNAEFVYKQGISRFLEGLSTFSNVWLFLMLGLLVFPSEILTFWKQGVVVALILILVARPLAVFLSTLFWDYSLKERVFLCWGGIRGAVPIVLATYPAAAGLPEGNYYFNIVFFVVLISALVQGSTIDFFAGKLDLLVKKKRTSPHSLELISLEQTRAELLEYYVEKDSYLVDKQLQDLPLPKDSLIIAIVRKDDIITPRGDTTIRNKDILFLLVGYEDKHELLELFDSEATRHSAESIYH
ncbi:Cation/H+ exchanger [Syntrophomonas zehnderi OL-4]|uniref:Cation/H+ exchanger n=1 Tax=Syntrophomonas zehnderi OL-4 TaxID=690567 RepID=A0A0E3W2X6_9FIRM|nr:potassium/proton antiporter [Syntrophomonas zehnderi]CFX29244.1 Cation/H+ exchanger [Syntrophomonas zehnderi OL-4]